MTIFSAALLLFLVMDPLGNIPFFIAALKDVDDKRRLKVIIRELFIALIVMVVFLFVGQFLLSFLQITGPALTVTGGIILFLIAVKMIFPSPSQPLTEKVSGEPFIVPLAIPYIAGPSALATMLLIMNREPERWPEWLVAVVGAWFFCGLIISMAGPLSKLLGEKALIAMERLMGMILVAIAIQMLMNGISQFVASI